MIEFESLFDCSNNVPFSKKMNAKTKEEQLDFKIKYFNRLARFSAKFLEITNGNDLAFLLNTDFHKVQILINNPIYQEYAIPKKSGGNRIIQAPDIDLLKAQRKLNRLLQINYLKIKPANVHGFVTKFPSDENHANIVENAMVHTGKKTVLNIDLENFFPSISAKTVKNVFSNAPFNFNNQISTALALLLTYKGKLPQGAPTSPVISNFVCLQLDHYLNTWSRMNNINYSRYADDLTFSADTFISQEKQQEIRQIINKFNFVVNEKKWRQRAKNRKQTVTGLTVNTKVNVDRRYLKKVRAMLHDLSVNGIEIAAINHFGLDEQATTEQKKKFLFRLQGSIGFIGQVRGKSDVIYQSMQKKLKEYQIVSNKILKS
jgi:RNA-directed DNA polymerase